MGTLKKNVSVFDRDTLEKGGYLYTDPAHLSGRLANERITKAIHSSVPLENRNIIDLGCGDGSYTMGLATGENCLVLGIDPAREPIAVAEKNARKNATPNIRFRAAAIEDVPEMFGDRFDIAILRGVLHHLTDPENAVRIAHSIAGQVVIVEPNGLNPGLKILEKVSRYHIEHGERSFAPSTIDRWCRSSGGEIVHREHFNFVPFFCPDWMARILSKAQPIVEAWRPVRVICCGQYLVVSRRK